MRQALIDRFGAPSTKKAPGLLYGVSSHMWAALALAVCAHDRRVTFNGTELLPQRNEPWGLPSTGAGSTFP